MVFDMAIEDGFITAMQSDTPQGNHAYAVN